MNSQSCCSDGVRSVVMSAAINCAPYDELERVENFSFFPMQNSPELE